jgi:hypothetical protein
MLTISILSGILFILGIIGTLIKDDRRLFPTGLGVVFSVAVWNFSITLGILGIVFSAICLICNILILKDR